MPASETIFNIPRNKVKILIFIILIIIFCISIGSGVVALHNYKKKDMNDDYTYSSKNLLNAQLYITSILIPLIALFIYYL